MDWEQPAMVQQENADESKTMYMQRMLGEPLVGREQAIEIARIIIKGRTKSPESVWLPLEIEEKMRSWVVRGGPVERTAPDGQKGIELGIFTIEIAKSNAQIVDFERDIPAFEMFRSKSAP